MALSLPTRSAPRVRGVLRTQFGLQLVNGTIALLRLALTLVPALKLTPKSVDLTTTISDPNRVPSPLVETLVFQRVNTA